MSDGVLPWGAEQWEKIRQVVHDEALRTRVAASFLPLYGPIPGGTEMVPMNALGYAPHAGQATQRMVVNDHDSLRLCSVSVNVFLRNHMLAEPDLSAATTMFRRAANIIARVEDAIVFNGRQPKGEKRSDLGLAGVDGIQLVYEVGGPEQCDGLLQYAAKPKDQQTSKERDPIQVGKSEPALKGPNVFEAVVNAVLELERAGYQKPFACVLGHTLFAEINRPIPNSMVLPRDSIPPFLDGPLLRSSTLAGNQGVVVSLQGEPVEIVVPADISVRYMQAMLDGGHAFRVSQRFRLRVKDHSAIAWLQDS
jgi:uncharacterized linocin/CFP29 family protein